MNSKKSVGGLFISGMRPISGEPELLSRLTIHQRPRWRVGGIRFASNHINGRKQSPPFLVVQLVLAAVVPCTDTPSGTALDHCGESSDVHASIRRLSVCGWRVTLASEHGFRVGSSQPPTNLAGSRTSTLLFSEIGHGNQHSEILEGRL